MFPPLLRRLTPLASRYGWLFLLLAALRLSAAEATSPFDIPAGTAEKTLKQFAAQSGVEVLYATDVARGVPTNAVKGNLPAGEAIKQMLDGTPLHVVNDEKNRVLRIARAPLKAKKKSDAPEEPTETMKRKNPNEAEAPSKPMNRKNILAMLGAWLAVVVAPADAQTTTTSQSPTTTPQSPAIVLNPFIVEEEEETGYYANNTLDGSRLNTPLRDTPAPISIFNREFLDDIGATDIESVLNYDVNVEVRHDTSDDRNTGQGEGSGAIENGAVYRNRGLNASFATNGFRNFANNADMYNIERVASSRGPNAILFGNGKAGGVVNFRTKQANPLRASNQIQLRYGSYDTQRATVDFNRPVIKDKLAVRLMGLVSHNKDYLPHAFKNQKEFTGAVQYRISEKSRLNVSFQRGFTHGVGAMKWGGVWDEVGRFLDSHNAGLVAFNPANERYELTAAGAAAGLGTAGSAAGTSVGVGNLGRRSWLIQGPAGPNGPTELWEHPNPNTNLNFITTQAGRLPEPNGSIVQEDMIPYNTTSVGGAGTFTVVDSSNLTATFNHQFFDSLYMELSYNKSEYYSDAARNNAGSRLRADLTYRLPDGTLNPYFFGNGYYFMWDPQGFRHQRNRDDETIRAAFSYDLNLGDRWGRHRFAVMGERHENRNFQWRVREQWANTPYGGNNPRRFDNLNHVYYRRYFKTDGPYDNYTVGYMTPANGPVTFESRHAGVGTLVREWHSPNTRDTFDNTATTESFLAVMQSYLFKGRLVTTFGVRQDSVDVHLSNMWVDPESGVKPPSAGEPITTNGLFVLAKPGDAGYNPRVQHEAGRRFSAGAVFHINDNFSLIANKSNGVDVSNNRSRIILPNDLSPDPFKATSTDFGLAFSFLENRISGSVRHFQSASEKEDTNSQVQAVYTFRDRDVLRSFASYFLEAGVTTFGSGDPIQSLEELESSLLSQANGYLSDQVSKGYEIELLANLTRNWTVRFGYSHQTRTRTNVLEEGEPWWEERLVLYDQLDAIYRARTGDTSVFNKPVFLGFDSEGGSNIQEDTVAERVAAKETELSLMRALEEKGFGNRPYKANIWTRYRFDTDLLRGWTVGGGVRWQEKNIAGYDVPTDTVLYGNRSFLVDAMLQYRSKNGVFGLFSDKVGVTYQLNVYNLLDNDDIVINSRRLRPTEAASFQSGAGASGAIGIAAADAAYIRRGYRQPPITAHFTVTFDF